MEKHDTVLWVNGWDSRFFTRNQSLRLTNMIPFGWCPSFYLCHGRSFRNNFTVSAKAAGRWWDVLRSDMSWFCLVLNCGQNIWSRWFNHTFGQKWRFNFGRMDYVIILILFYVSETIYVFRVGVFFGTKIAHRFEIINQCRNLCVFSLCFRCEHKNNERYPVVNLCFCWEPPKITTRSLGRNQASAWKSSMAEAYGICMTALATLREGSKRRSNNFSIWSLLVKV